MERRDIEAEEAERKELDRKSKGALIAVGVLIVLAGVTSAVGNRGAAAAFFGASVAVLFSAFWFGTRRTK